MSYTSIVSSYSDHCNLHSFPTRRSSDLVIPGERGKGEICLNGAAARMVHPGDKVIVISRSEEHTSELQSPCKLVCRLLPEKTKKENSKLSEVLDAAPIGHKLQEYAIVIT